MPSPREKASKQARRKNARKRESIIANILHNLKNVQDPEGNIFQFTSNEQEALDTVVSHAEKRCNLTATTQNCSDPILVYETRDDGCNFYALPVRSILPGAEKNASLTTIPPNSGIAFFACRDRNNTQQVKDCIKSSILNDCDITFSKLAIILSATIPASVVILAIFCILYNKCKREKQDSMQQPLTSGVNDSDEKEPNRCRC